MKCSNTEKQFGNEALPSIQDLSKHYKEFLQKKHNQTIKQPNENKIFKNSLNEDITIEEIKQTIKKLKSKKSPRKQQHYKHNDKVLWWPKATALQMKR